MALVRALEKIPEHKGKTRRGILVAIELPTGMPYEGYIEKSIEELDDPVILRADSIGYGEDPICRYQQSILHLRELHNQIMEGINQGKAVIVYGYLLRAFSQGYADNAFGVRGMQEVAAARTLLNQIKGMILPDITFFVMPSTETYVNKLVSLGACTEDDFLYSDYATQLDGMGVAARYTDDTVVFRNDPIAVKTEMLNMILMTAITKCYNPVKFYSC